MKTAVDPLMLQQIDNADVSAHLSSYYVWTGTFDICMQAVDEAVAEGLAAGAAGVSTACRQGAKGLIFYSHSMLPVVG